MKNIKNWLFIFALGICVFPQLCTAQENLDFEFSYDVKINYPPLSVSKQVIKAAKSLNDLNPHYKSSWVHTFKSVEISTMQAGKRKQTFSKNDILTAEQKESLLNADAATDISIVVTYIPENDLSHNDIHTFDFNFQIDPDFGAAYLGGKERLNKHLQENAFDKIPPATFKQYQLTVIKFSIDITGAVVDAHVFESSNNERADELLLNAIKSTSPSWEIAEYANGLQVKQDFVLTAGDHRSCVLNTVNVRHLR